MVRKMAFANSLTFPGIPWPCSRHDLERDARAKRQNPLGDREGTKRLQPHWPQVYWPSPLLCPIPTLSYESNRSRCRSLSKKPTALMGARPAAYAESLLVPSIMIRILFRSPIFFPPLYVPLLTFLQCTRTRAPGECFRGNVSRLTRKVFPLLSQIQRLWRKKAKRTFASIFPVS